MAPRGFRVRKTANQMAVYKAAASKKRQPSQTASRTSPRKRSPDKAGLKNSSINGSYKSGGAEKGGIPRGEPKATNSSSLTRSGVSPVDRKQDKGGQVMFDPDEIIPETPPRENHVPSRKRVHAPAVSDSSKVDVHVRAESGKPSKKRRLFHTPPREQMSATRKTPPLETVKNMEEDVVSESEDLEMNVDDLVRASFDSAQNTLLPSSRLVGSTRDSRPVHNPFFNRSVPHPEAAPLDVMAISSAAMSRMFQGLTTNMISEMKRVGEAQVAELRKVGTAVSEAVAYEIRGLHGLVEMISSGMRTNGSVRTGGKTTLSDWEKRLDALTTYVNAIFGKKLLSRILCCNFPVKCVGIYQKYEHSGMNDVERASLSAQTMMFSLQPRDKKYQYSGDVGQLHSDFKFSVVQNSFFNVQRDTFRLFKVEGNGIEDGARLGAVNAAVLSRPSWLGEGKVLMDHINQARSFIETAGQTRKDKIRRIPTPDDIACHGALRVYRQLGARLHDGRGSLRIAFFVGVGYLLVPWKDRIAEFDQSSVEFSMEEEDLTLTLEDIPFTAQCNPTDDSVTVSATDAKNKELLRKLFADCPGMILTVFHDVKITKRTTETSKRGKHGERRKSLHRFINLIYVACGCCVEFCGAESTEVFLRTHKSSLQCVMLFALLFKAFCLEFLAMRSEKSSAASAVPEPTEVKVFGSCLKDFIPGLDTQKTILSQKCLHMTQTSFDMLNHADADTHDSADEAAGLGGVLDMRHIQESAEHGISMI